MSDLNWTDALDSVRIRFKVLKQANPGDIIVLDASGRWLLQASNSWSTWKSAVRKIWAFFSPSPIESQRQAFLKSAKESVKVMIHHCRLLMSTQLFNRLTDETGVISIKVMQKLNSVDLNDLEVLLQNLQSFCGDLHDGLNGLTNVLLHQPYATDLTYVSEVQVSLCDPIRQFLDQTVRRLGVVGIKLLPFLVQKPPSNTGFVLSSAPIPTIDSEEANNNNNNNINNNNGLTRASSSATLSPSATVSSIVQTSHQSVLKSKK